MPPRTSRKTRAYQRLDPKHPTQSVGAQKATQAIRERMAQQHGMPEPEKVAAMTGERPATVREIFERGERSYAVAEPTVCYRLLCCLEAGVGLACVVPLSVVIGCELWRLVPLVIRLMLEGPGV